MILSACEESSKNKMSIDQEEMIQNDSVILDQSETKMMTTSDTVTRVLSSFLTRINSTNIDSKRIDRILSSRIIVNKLDYPNSNSLIIKHKDNDNYFLAEVIVPDNFNIQLLNNGWVCSIRNKNGTIDGPLAIYYPNFVKMYITTYKEGKQVKNEDVYDTTGCIIVQARN